MHFLINWTPALENGRRLREKNLLKLSVLKASDSQFFFQLCQKKFGALNSIFDNSILLNIIIDNKVNYKKIDTFNIAKI